jgi:predicted Rossmann-fold nucleotide-binding protein
LTTPPSPGFSLLGKVQGAEGGFGTLDEVFEVVALIQTGKLDRFPIVTMGWQFWERIRTFIRDTLVHEGTIDAADLEIAQPARTPEEAVRLIRAGMGSP